MTFETLNEFQGPLLWKNSMNLGVLTTYIRIYRQIMFDLNVTTPSLPIFQIQTAITLEMMISGTKYPTNMHICTPYDQTTE